MKERFYKVIKDLSSEPPWQKKKKKNKMDQHKTLQELTKLILSQP